MSGGWLVVVGLGPGAADLTSPRAQAAISAASDFIGYGPYVARITPRADQTCHVSDNREELARAGHALTLASQGRRVAVLSSGDAGVFAMAAAIFEAVEQGEACWRDVEIEVIPGISAILAAAARVGAPYGNDFCVISLSDNLKPWPVILKRLDAAAKAGFAMALYNPISRARPWQLGQALDLLRTLLPGTVPVIFARAVSRPEEHIFRTTLDHAEPAQADMQTLVMVGTAQTRTILRNGADPWIYTPRSVPEAP